MTRVRPTEIRCQEVWREISNYLEGTVEPAVRARMAAHFRRCKHCTAVLEGTSNTVRLVADSEAFALPAGFAERLQSKLDSKVHRPTTQTRATRKRQTIALGVAEANVELGAHLVYFWQDDLEFAQGVGFLEPGLRSDHHCVIFGHDEINHRVIHALRNKGFDVPRLVNDRRVTVLRRELSTQVILDQLKQIFDRAARDGFSGIRFLGNLSWGYPGCPEQDQVLELEAKVTGLANQFPCVVVCMYDVGALPGRMVLKGGFETHPYTLCSHGLRENPLYVPEADFMAQLGNKR